MHSNLRTTNNLSLLSGYYFYHSIYTRVYTYTYVITIFPLILFRLPGERLYDSREPIRRT